MNIFLDDRNEKIPELLFVYILFNQKIIAGDSDLQKRRGHSKLIFLSLNQNICCGYSNEPSRRDSSFEHPKHIFRLTHKKIITNLRSKYWLISTNENGIKINMDLGNLVLFSREINSSQMNVSIGKIREILRH